MVSHKYQPCGYPPCPAVAEEQVYCSIHRPEKVIERVKTIITTQFQSITHDFFLGEIQHARFDKLLNDIIKDLETTL